MGVPGRTASRLWLCIKLSYVIWTKSCTYFYKNVQQKKKKKNPTYLPSWMWWLACCRRHSSQFFLTWFWMLQQVQHPISMKMPPTLPSNGTASASWWRSMLRFPRAASTMPSKRAAKIRSPPTHMHPNAWRYTGFTIVTLLVVHSSCNRQTENVCMCHCVCVCVCERERERERERQTDRQTDRQAGRKTDREGETETERERERERGRDRSVSRQREGETQREREGEREMERDGILSFQMHLEH